MTSIDTLFATIAAEHLGISTLKTRNSDSLDFHSVAAWQVKTALAAAFKAGVNAGCPATEPPQDLPPPFDDYEISPCRRYAEPDSPGKFYFEVCEPHEADVWTLYGHVNGEGVQAIGDFATSEHAEEVFCRITGLKFSGSYKTDAHLRIMHAGPKLLKVAELAWRRAANHEKLSMQECNELCAVIAQATGRTP